MEFYSKAFFVALAVLVAYGMLLVLQPFAGSMAWAIFLAFLLHPLHRWLTGRLRGKPSLSAGLITGLTPFALLTPLTLLAFEFVNQARALVHFVRGSDFKLDGSILIQLEQYPLIGPLARLAREELAVSAADIQEWLGRATDRHQLAVRRPLRARRSARRPSSSRPPTATRGRRPPPRR